MDMAKLSQLLVIFLLVGSGVTEAQTNAPEFLQRSIVLDGIEHRYQVYVPQNYAATSAWPAILFLHGAGERGNDGLKQTEVGLGTALRSHPERWPAIVIMPQVPEGENWQGRAGEVAMAALEAAVAEFTVDASRIYLTGISMGGNGTWYLGYKHTDRFAALVAICGFVALGDRYPAFVATSTDAYKDLAQALSNKPVWLVNGDADVVVPVEESRRMARELETAGAEIHYTELPGVNHNSWDAAYENEELISWLFRQRLH